MTVNLAVIAVVAAAIAITLMVKRPTMKRAQALLMLVAGFGLAGGVASNLRGWLQGLWTDAGSDLTSAVFGAAVSYSIALVIVVWFCLDMDIDGLYRRHKKKKKSAGGGDVAVTNKHTVTNATPWLGFLVPVALGALPYLGVIPDAIRTWASG